MSQHEVKLGELISGPESRDAIHIAVAPVVAGETLKPGEHVGIVDGKAIGSARPCLGIVDPFLQDDVHEGDHFWLCLYPRTITSLRHDWSHPQFATEDPCDPWVAVRLVAAKLDVGVDTLMKLADGYSEAAIGCCCWWPENYGEASNRSYSIDWAKEFWPHWKAIRGERAATAHDHGDPFECNC